MDTVKEFIKNHNKQYTNYCEIVILKDGTPIYATPSHIMKLEMIWGVPENEIFDGGEKLEELKKEMPLTASPIHWLSEKTQSAVCWYNAVILPFGYTAPQIDTVKQLIRHECLSQKIEIDIATEKTHEENRADYELIERLNQTKRQLTQKLYYEFGKEYI